MNWISVKDRLPKKYVDVLTYSKEFGVRLNYIDGKGFMYEDERKPYCIFGKVTHWMPLPEPPEEAESE